MKRLLLLGLIAVGACAQEPDKATIGQTVRWATFKDAHTGKCIQLECCGHVLMRVATPDQCEGKEPK